MQGYEIELNPGDVLYIPHHWWHHVETIGGDEGVDGLSLSLNLWFDFEPRLVAPPLPLTSGLLIELARHVESWLGSLLGEKQVPQFLESCALELSTTKPHVCSEAARRQADEANEAALPRQWLVARSSGCDEEAAEYNTLTPLPRADSAAVARAATELLHVTDGTESTFSARRGLGDLEASRRQKEPDISKTLRLDVIQHTMRGIRMTVARDLRESDTRLSSVAASCNLPSCGLPELPRPASEHYHSSKLVLRHIRDFQKTGIAALLGDPP